MTQANIELLDALRDAGAADDKARAAAQSVAAVGDVATKEDISAVRTEMTTMRTEMATMRTEMATKEDISALRAEMTADMATMEVRLIRWMVGMILPQYALLTVIALRLPW